MQNKFFESKLNTVLLLVLIILMIIALVVMSKNKEMYLSGFKQLDQKNEIGKNQDLSNNEILGNKESLISFSVKPGQVVSGKMEVTGSISGGYFFEANVLINVLDGNKNILRKGYGTATTDWMTSDPVSFTASIDFTGLNKGNAYIEIKNDDPSDGEGGPAKKILIPVIIKESNSFNSSITDENIEEQLKWARENNGLPNGWVRWADTIGGVSVEKYGPSKTGSSYMVHLTTEIMESLKEKKFVLGILILQHVL